MTFYSLKYYIIGNLRFGNILMIKIMKFTNLSKLLIKFIGGGLVNFPTRYLKEVELEAEGGESDGGGSGNDDELVLHTKEVIANRYQVEIDDVKLPEHYVVFKRSENRLIEVSKEIAFFEGNLADTVIAIYSKDTVITKNSVAAHAKTGLGFVEESVTLNKFIDFSTVKNETSLNLDDYVFYNIINDDESVI